MPWSWSPSLEVGDRRDGRFDCIGDCAHETGGRRAIADAMVEDERHLGDLSYGHLTVYDPGTVDDPAEAEDRYLRVVDDRCTAVDVERPVVVEGEGAGREL